MKKLTASEFETDLVVAGIDPNTLSAISENSEPIWARALIHDIGEPTNYEKNIIVGGGIGSHMPLLKIGLSKY